MQLRTRTPLQTLHVPVATSRSNLLVRSPAAPPSSSSSSLVTPSTLSLSPSSGVRRSRRVAKLHGAVRSMKRRSLDTAAAPSQQDSMAEVEREEVHREEDRRRLVPERTAPVRLKQIKVSSAGVPKIVTRATKETKRRRMSMTSEERKLMQFCLLQSAFSSEDDKIDETSWLTSTLMDLMLWRLANQYPNIHFLPTDFFHCFLESRSRNYHQHQHNHHRHAAVAATTDAGRVPVDPSDSEFLVRDVLGRMIDYTSDRPILFAVNIGLIHWNLFRVQLAPHPELQLFEPMGRLASRTGISYRSVPRSVVEWLEICYPQHKNWISKAVSAITKPQQVSGFDCGVACLLYADKCGQGQTRQQINECTDQRAITSFRKTLQQQLRSMQNSV